MNLDTLRRPDRLVPLLAVGVVALAFVVLPLAEGRGLRVFDLFNGLQGAAQFGFIAIALGLTMIAGEFDLSVTGERQRLVAAIENLQPINASPPGASGFDGATQRFDVAGVAGQLLGPVVQHRHRHAGTVRVGGGACQLTPGRQGGGLGEAVPGHQDGVGQEVVEVGQVAHTTLGQVHVRLDGDTGRHRGMGHQLGVGALLPADHDGRQPGGPDRVDAGLPGPVPAQDADDHQVHAVQQLGQVLDQQPGRVGPPVVGAAGAGGDEVGVRGGQQQHGRSGVVSGGVAHLSFSTASASSAANPEVPHSIERPAPATMEGP